MAKAKKVLSTVLVALFTVFTVLSYVPAQTTKAAAGPKVQIVAQPNAEYKVGDRVLVKFNSPNYKGIVQYRAFLWNRTTQKFVQEIYKDYPGFWYKPVCVGTSVFTIDVFYPQEPGTYYIGILVKAKGAKTYSSYVYTNTFTVKAKEEQKPEEKPATGVEVNSVTTNILNAVEGYQDVVYLGKAAQVVAKAVDKDGRPVPNVPVLFEVEEKKPLDYGKDVKFEQSVVYTDAQGNAIGFLNVKDSKITDPAVTATYKVSVVGKAVAPVTGKVRFASLSVGTVSVTKPVNSDGVVELNPSVNADFATYKSAMVTKNMNSDDTYYVASQKVSETGKDTNAVTFSVTPKMVYIADSATEATDVYVKSVNWKSGAYHPYDDKATDAIQIPSGLKYATVYLKNLQLDEKAKLYVEFYKSDDTANGSVVVSGPINDISRAVQIPQDKLSSTAYIKVRLKTEGQVNTSLNGGVEVEKIEGVFKTSASTTTKSVTIPNAKINWTLSDVVYSETKVMSSTTASAYGITVNNAVKYLYQVPVFPFTGDAVVTVYDINNKVLEYYLIPTVNVNNENVLKTGVTAIKVSKDEAFNKVGVITQNTDGTTVTVNSDKVGYSLLKGTIEIPGVSKDILNATNATVYTSVNWAPLPGTVATTQNAVLFALQGQRVEIIAQLVDVNGNPATIVGQNVTLKYGKNVGNVSFSQSLTLTTDSNGQAKWTLGASSLALLKDVKVENSTYKVVMKIGNESVTQADIYWIGAKLTHTVDGTTYDSASVVSNNYKAQYNVGNGVEFGFKANGVIVTDADATVKAVKLSNIPVDFSKVTGTVGSAEKVNDILYCFLAKSQNAGIEMVDSKIASNITNATVKYTTDNVNYVEGKFVGTGTHTIYDKFTMPIVWKSQGAQFNFIVPQGNVATTGSSVTVYVKVADSYGNPLKGVNVNLALTGVGTTSSAITTTTNDGIASVKVTSTEVGQSTIKAEYNGETIYYSINWIASTGKMFQMVSAGVNSTGSNDVITLTFSGDIKADSVLARQFTIEDTTSHTVYAVKNVEVAGNQIKLTLADSNAHLYNKETTTYNVVYNPYTEFDGQYAGIAFDLVSVDGITLTPANSIKFVTPSNVAVKTVSLTGTTLNVAFFNAANLDVYVVGSNGKVYTSTLDANGSKDITVDSGVQSFTIYCNGVSYTYFNY